MKAAINGLPNFSILDGWWMEGLTQQTDGRPANGWGFDGGNEGPQHDQDQYDANRMYDMLEKEIIPLYYDQTLTGISHGWLKVVKESIATILPRFSSERMMREYAEKMYAPASSKN
jgi:starch phosphorylase